VVEDSVGNRQQRAEAEDVNEPTLTALTNSGNTNAEGARTRARKEEGH
jgi:hypothetical protein